MVPALLAIPATKPCIAQTPQLLATLQPIDKLAKLAQPDEPDALPNAPEPQASATTLTGTVIDRDGDAIVEAHVTLTIERRPPTEVRTGADGRFYFANLQPGSYTLSLTATGFASQQAAGTLHVGESLALPAFTLTASSTSAVQVTATQADIAQAQIQEAEKQRVFGALPNFYVSYDSNPAPLRPRQKAELAYKTILDPSTFVIAGVIAGIQQGTNTYPSWGQDAPAFGKRYGAAFGTIFTGTLLGNAVFPILLKQDPRYFVKGNGTVRARVLYALANAVICKGDSMRWQPNYSSILGNLAAVEIATFYYPAADRDGTRTTLINAAIGIAATGAGNIFQEFLVRKLTPHAAKPKQPATANP